MILTIAGQKGGAGKTTVAISLATQWMSNGHRVLLVDADPQHSAKTWGEVAAESGHPAPTVVSMGVGLHRPDQLPALAASFDVVVVDCPPRHGEIQRAALMVADLAILPCGPSALDVWALGDSLDLIHAAQEVKPSLKVVVLITRKIPRTVLASSVREALCGVGLPVLDTELSLRINYPEAIAAGLGVTQYAPKSPASDEIKSLAKEIETLQPLEKKDEAKTRRKTPTPTRPARR
jgi:chromosome partitioning protein